MKNIVIGIILLSLCVFVAYGQPQPPCPETFWGNVTINGSIAPNGTLVSAWINGVMKVSCKTENWKGTYKGKLFNYLLEVYGREGDTVVFKIYNATVATDTFNCPEITNLDLHLWDEEVNESAQITINYTAGTDYLTVNWTSGYDMTGISHYELWRRYENGNFTFVKRFNATDERTYTDTNLLSGKYTYRLCTFDLVGNKNCSEADVTVSIGGVGNITGRITYTNNSTGIPNVNVTLIKDGILIANTSTNSTGYFSFVSLNVGNYTVNASKPRFWCNETDVAVFSGNTTEVSMMMWLKGDFNNNGKSADAGDVCLMMKASVWKIIPDWRYDLNRNGKLADAGDVSLIMKAAVGKIVLW